MRGKKELVRIVHTADGQFALDPTGKSAGRGAYLCPDVACLGNAVKRKSFDRAFRQAVPRDALATLETGIREYLRAQAGGESEGNDEG